LGAERGNQTWRKCFPNTGERSDDRKVGVLSDDGFYLLVIVLDGGSKQMKLAHQPLHKDRRTVHHRTVLGGRYRLANLIDKLVNIRRT